MPGHALKVSIAHDRAQFDDKQSDQPAFSSFPMMQAVFWQSVE
jgi:hypothetical protein